MAEARPRRRLRVPDKALVVGTAISLTSYDDLLETLASRPDDEALTAAFCNVHSVMTARRDADLAAALGRFDVATPDGVPLVWALRLLANKDQERVYGPELMKRAVEQSTRFGWTHYLYGSTAETLDRLQDAIARLSEDAVVAGVYSPPFRRLTEQEEAAVLEDIRRSGADLVWVGLGMPKQELWIDRVDEYLPGKALLAVGAAFDFLAGTKKQAPRWMQRAGLEWFYRLLQEPRRLWRRYVWNNPVFLMLLARQIITSRFRRTSR